MHLLITGGTGFIGERLIEALLAQEHTVTVLTRQSLSGTAALNYVQSLDDIASDTQLDAAINLAGASLAARRWSPAYKREIVNSRLGTTRALLALFKRLQSPPATLLSASAIGYYGHQGDTVLAEDAPVNSGFSSQLCHDWEQAAEHATELGVRVCLLRLGVVMDSSGGALQEMSRSFGLGVASWIGRGDQWLSWVHRADVVRAMLFLLNNNALSGAFNLTAPEPVTAKDFALALKEHYRTLVTAAVPAVVMRAALGEMAQELLLNGQRVVPARLLAAGFEFSHPHITGALQAIYSNKT